MKLTLMAGIFATVTSTTAFAENFKSNEYVATAVLGNLEFSLGTVDDVNTISAGAYIFPGAIGSYSTNLFVSAGYNMDTEDYRVAAEYNAVGSVSHLLTTYASVEVAYLSTDDVLVTPSVGLNYAISGAVDVFGEVDYTFLASDDFSRVDGTVELGLDIGVSDTFSIRPSVVTSFESEETNGRLELVARF